MLERFRQAKQAEIEALRELDRSGRLPGAWVGVRPSLAQALKELGPGAVVAEYKRASPSRGEINLGLGPEEVGRMYREAGAAAVSVLTEETYFKGELGFLERMHAAGAAGGLPLLRKDFILDRLQVVATAATPASALLLIVRMLGPGELSGLIELSGRLGLEAVVEVFDELDLDRARRAGSSIIQVNNRDLDRLVTDMGVSRRLITAKRPGEVWIAASGIETPEDARSLAGLGYEGILVGSSLMGSGNPKAALAGLVRASRGIAGVRGC